MRDEELELIDGCYDLAIQEALENADRKPITVWIPSEYKKRYEALQMTSNYSASKAIKKILIKSIIRLEERLNK